MKKYKVEDHETTPIMNIIWRNKDFVDEYNNDLLQNLKNKIDKKIPSSSIELLLSKLGNPITHWVGGSENRRFKIWVGNGWRVFAHKIAGAMFEVNEGFTPEQAMNAWREYQNLLNKE